MYQVHQIGTALTAIRNLHSLVEVAVCRITDDLPYQNVTLFVVEGEHLVYLGSKDVLKSFSASWHRKAHHPSTLAFKIGEHARLHEESRKHMQNLAELNRELQEKERLLVAFDRICQAVLASLDLEQILDILATQIVGAGIFTTDVLSRRVREVLDA